MTPTVALCWAMRVLSWAFIAVGVLIGVFAFVLTADTPAVNPWPYLGAGLVLTLLGVFLLMTEGRQSGQD